MKKKRKQGYRKLGKARSIPGKLLKESRLWWWVKLKKALSLPLKNKPTTNKGKEASISLPPQRYETGIDALRRIVVEKGKIKFKDAINIMHITPELGQEWVSILEQKGLIAIKYPAIGDMLLLKPEAGETR